MADSFSMIYPPFLKEGDRVAIVSPSGAVDTALIDGACEVLSAWGLVPVVFPHAKGQCGRFAGTDAERLTDLQAAMDDTSVAAILSGRGGYGAMRIVDGVDFTGFRRHPKWLIGFSDITALHAAVAAQGLASLHAVMTKALAHEANNRQSVERLRKLLFGDLPNYEVKSHPKNRVGRCEGELVGGNLSLLYALRGTPFDIQPKGKVLFIEDLAERRYHIDRMMQNLRLSGILSQISGLVVGQFTDIPADDSFPLSVEDIVLNAVGDAPYPVVFNFPVGHVARNMPLIHGGRVRLSVNEKKSSLRFLP